MHAVEPGHKPHSVVLCSTVLGVELEPLPVTLPFLPRLLLAQSVNAPARDERKQNNINNLLMIGSERLSASS